MNHHGSLVALAFLASMVCPTGPTAHAQDRLTTPTSSACPDSAFTCITLRVPLDHFGSSDETIEVVFGILPARNQAERKGMFVTVVGGPGASGLQTADSYAATLDDAIRDVFDLVFFDQRGIGLSGGFDCAQAAATYYQTDGRSRTPAQEQALIAAARRFAEDCLRSLPPPERLQFYSTRQAVEDLEAFRRVMGDERIWLYGESYGTQFAQWYAAMHSDRVAGLILDGAVDLALDGIQFARDTTRAFNDTLVATLRDCNAQPACRRDMGGDAIRAYDRLANQLDRTPATLRFPLPGGGGTVARTIGLSELETAAAGFLYSEGERMLLQRAIAAASRGDFILMARLFYASLGLDPATLEPLPSSSYSDAAYYVVTCNDYRYFDGTPEARARAYLRAGDAVERAIPRMRSVFYGDLPCAFWPRLGTPAEYDPTPARHVPTLILGATADPATPVEQGRAIFRRLARAHLITTRGGAHVTFNRGNDCPDRLVTRFLVEGRLPARAETRCAGAIADGYVPLAPADSSAFGDALAAMQSVENEILHMPEFYYWDQAREAAFGCPYGGSVSFDLDRAGATVFTLARCAFSKGLVITGTGRHHPGDGQFILNVEVAGYRSGRLDYEHMDDAYHVAGLLDGRWIEKSTR